MKRKSERREDLLDASIEYLLEHGVADLSLRPLAAKVGSKARLLVYHFGSKEALVTDAMIIVRDRVQHNFAALVKNDQGRKPSQMMRAFWNWAISKEHERYLRLFFEVHGLALQKPKLSPSTRKGRRFTPWRDASGLRPPPSRHAVSARQTMVPYCTPIPVPVCAPIDIYA